MAITDLTGTSWYFNDVIDFRGWFNVDFYQNHDSTMNCTEIYGDSYGLQYGTDDFRAYVYFNDTSSWADGTLHRAITITGGADVSDPDLIQELQANATQLFEVSYETEHGTIPESRWVESGHLLTAEDLPELEADGYDFQGWYYGKLEPITDLTGTTWYFNNRIADGTKIGKVNFICSGETYISMNRIGDNFDYIRPSGGVMFVYGGYEWKGNFRTVHITGGEDATNLDFISWLKSNATIKKAAVGDEITEDTALVAVWKKLGVYIGNVLVDSPYLNGEIGKIYLGNKRVY